MKAHCDKASDHHIISNNGLLNGLPPPLMHNALTCNPAIQFKQSIY